MPKFYMIFARKMNKWPNVTWYLFEKYFPIFFGGGRAPMSPTLKRLRCFNTVTTNNKKHWESENLRQAATINFVESHTVDSDHAECWKSYFMPKLIISGSQISVWLPNVVTISQSAAELLRFEDFRTAVLTLNFDPELSNVNKIWLSTSAKH